MKRVQSRPTSSGHPTRPVRKVRTQIQLTEEQLRKLRDLAEQKRQSIADLVRQSIDLYLQEESQGSKDLQRERALAVVGQFASGINDLSSEHDRYLGEAFGQ